MRYPNASARVYREHPLRYGILPDPDAAHTPLYNWVWAAVGLLIIAAVIWGAR